jgi:spermidine synthase/MFS family permease
MLKKSMSTSTVSPVSYVYFALFFVSGVSGLIYESIWSQYLKQFLGHAAYSQTLVLVIYMGGMALGSWIAALGVSRLRNLLLVYAIVEIALGILALAFHGVFIRYLDISFDTIIPFLNQPLPIALYKWTTASIIILPQSILLGATFPLMAGGILRRFPGLSGYKTSVIYFVNTFGASFGVLISGFYLTKHWGLKGAIISAGILDLFVGFAILALCLTEKKAAKKEDSVELTPTSDGEIECRGGDDGERGSYPQDPDDIFAVDKEFTTTPIDNRNYYYPLLAIACLTATASFIYEIGWIRMLSLVLGSSTHSFELMLSAFILGLALGSFFVRNKLDTIKNAPRFLGIVQIVMGATAIMTLFSYGNMFNFMVFTLDGLDDTESGYIFFNIISHVICMVIMLPSTICAGMVIPLIIHMLYKKGYGEQAIGKAYAVNTAGGILGVVIAVWVLMELVGLKWLITIGAALDIGIGLYVLYHFAETRHSITRTVAQPVALAVLLLAVAFANIDPILASSGVFRYASISSSKRIVGHIDGRTATISLFRTAGNNLVLSTNGKPDASVGMGEEFSSDEHTMALLGLLPLSARHETRTAAVIGMGAGMTAHYMLYDPMIERLDVVEIEPAMVKLARQIGPKVANAFEDPRSRIYIEDAKTFFSAQSRSYDVIVSEPSNPWVSGVSSLFSVEFFRHIRRHINDGGLLVQWFHSYEADITILASILKALEESFPVYDMYAVGSDLIILAAKDSVTDISIKRDIFQITPIAVSMGKMGFAGIDDFRMMRIMGSGLLRPLVNSYPTPANTDFHSFVDQYAVKHRFMGNHVRELSDIRDFIIPVHRIIFADTNYMSLSPHRLMPDVSNLLKIRDAKAIAQELAISAIDSVAVQTLSISAPILVLDYASIRQDKITFLQVQNAIVQILQATLPYLSVDEMREIWSIIEKKVEEWELTEEQAKLMAYFKALCSYDITEMRRLSLELLPSDSIPVSYGNQMLMASLLASSAVLNDTAGVGRMWEIYRERRRPAGPPASIRAVRAMLGLD